ncbi:hypothetical protein D9615_004012 [Tricholomella constricta]|uniref:Autophagy-related protein 2 n=1 Tax=Tricholomella constricta TaxID=117010 RepID=A0A8H5HCS4_9AGAR|nr:hypothetical protein D9615_004012 [Tricholomella constricta]
MFDQVDLESRMSNAPFDSLGPQRVYFDPQHAIRHVTVRQILEVERMHSTALFKIEGKEFKHLSLVANVCSTRIFPTYRDFELDDGTGRIKARQWDSDFVLAPDLGPLEDNSFPYVRVIGVLQDYQNTMSISITTIDLVTDFYEPYYHILQAICDTLAYERGQPAGMRIQTDQSTDSFDNVVDTAKVSFLYRSVPPIEPTTTPLLSRAFFGGDNRTPPVNVDLFTSRNNVRSSADAHSAQASIHNVNLGQLGITTSGFSSIEVPSREIDFAIQSSLFAQTPGHDADASHFSRTASGSASIVRRSHGRDFIREASGSSAIREKRRSCWPGEKVDCHGRGAPSPLPRSLLPNVQEPLQRAPAHDPFSHLSSLQRDIILCVGSTRAQTARPQQIYPSVDGTSQEESWEGVHVSIIVSAVKARRPNLTPQDFRHSIEELIEEGYVFSTIDDFHYNEELYDAGARNFLFIDVPPIHRSPAGLPSLNFALPSSLQRRFISFVLKKSLGHLLRPGQLDFRQIDSQIGSGFVQINDLELDNGAINDLISDLPVVLHDGFITSVVARVPWPNPLTSTLGFSIDTLHLTFHLLPVTSRTHHKNRNLADSVASVAESFIHDELTPQEGATLWDSFHPDTAGENPPEDDLTVPGGLSTDPFLSNPEEMVHSDVDPAGVSIFATLIERLLARFEFDATNTTLTLVHPGNMSVTASISEIRYRTDDPGDAPRLSPENAPSVGQRRTLSITGVDLTARNLRPEAPPPQVYTPNAQPASTLSSPPSPSPHSLRPVSPSSSSSSLDEETQFTMSQSLAFLPPRPVSPNSSIASSMYQSAISTAPTFIEGERDHGNLRGSITTLPARADDPPTITHPRCDQPPDDEQAEVLVSFGSSPILIQVSTSSPMAPETEFPFSPQASPPVHNNVRGDEALRMTVTLGVIACALKAWHVRGLLSLAKNFTTRHAHDDRDPPSQSVIDVQIAVKLRGLVLLVLLPSSDDREAAHRTLLADFFKWSLVPPVLPHGYLRLYLESISASLSSISVSEDFPGLKSTRSTRTTVTKNLSCGLTVGDFSLFSVYGTSSASTAEPTILASPILITDRDLTSQYDVHHHHPSKDRLDPNLPIFQVVDWTNQRFRSNGLKLSLWRTKSTRRPAQHETHVDSRASSAAISITFKTRMVSTSSRHGPPIESGEIDIKVIPLHILLDLGNALRCDRILAFLDEAIGDKVELGHGSTHDPRPRSDLSDDSDGDAETPPASPRARNTHEEDKERRRMEKLVLQDLNLDFDHGADRPTDERMPTKQRTRKFSATGNSDVKASITINMIRVQIRCPSPLQCSPRSGALVIDLHGVRLFTAPEPLKQATRFATTGAPIVPRPSEETFLLGADFKRIIIACSSVHESSATSILSAASLASSSDDGDVVLELVAPLHPRIAITKSKPASTEFTTVMALSICIPSVVVDISKPILDSLQYWADDVAQHLDRIFNGEYEGNKDDTATEKADSRDTSLIGSRYFAKSRSGSGSALSTSPESSQSETVIKLTISEAFVRAMVPRAQRNNVQPFIASASDIDVLIELKPEGKDETVLTLGVMDVTIINMPTPHSSQIFMSLTAPRSLASAPKSMVKLRFTSLVVPGITAKESRVKLTLSGFTFTIFPDFSWTTDLGVFVKSPPGTFESVIPSERTRISLKVSDGAIRTFAPNHPGAIVVQIDDLDFATDVIGKSPDSSFQLSIPAVALLVVDDVLNEVDMDTVSSRQGVALWKSAGFALLAEVGDLYMGFAHTIKPPTTNISLDHVRFQVHICADSLSAVTAFANDLATVFKPPGEEKNPKPSRGPTMVSKQSTVKNGLMASVDDLAFMKVPDVGTAPDMISDDLPTNMDYLDESFGAAAGLRELRDDDLDEFDIDESQAEYPHAIADGTGVISRIGGETIKILRPEGIKVTESYFDNLSPDASGVTDQFGETAFRLRLRDSDITLFLYDGYDWPKTRKTIEEEVKGMRRRLAKIRQLVASGQVQDPSAEETSALLFNSLYIGLDHDVDGLEPGALIAAIDEELKEDVETSSQSSWQSLKPPSSGKPRGRSVRVHGKRLTRSRNPSMEFRLFGLEAEVDHYLSDAPVVSRTLATVRDLEILDHIKTSTWKKFLTSLRSDSRGNIRETNSNMIRVELRSVRPVPGHPVEEARLRAKILPLRFFKDPHAYSTAESDNDDEIYFQSAEVFPVDLKLDYKPRRVDYRALREGRTIELMNFFHFDGAEMTLRHITLAGITGWPRLFELLNDLWTPDVKATQLVEVISGVAPIRSVVNVGSGVADLVLLPIAQYKKDGRIVRGVQKGTTAFVKSTAIEAIKLGARLATGTQVILEQAEGVLGGQFSQPITAETVQSTAGDDFTYIATDDDEESDLISKYSQQPVDIKEGVQSAYKSLRKNFNSAAQTILAVPMEVYERSGNEGPVRSVIRAVPIAVLKPMIGASEAVSKTLLGLHNSLDPDIRHENEAKYKRR